MSVHGEHREKQTTQLHTCVFDTVYLSVMREVCVHLFVWEDHGLGARRKDNIHWKPKEGEDRFPLFPT